MVELPVAVLDANVLHSYPLTLLLLELAVARLFLPVWSEDIHVEWIRSVVRARPTISMEQLGRRRRAMDAALPQANVSGYRSLIPSLSLPDPDDRHVLAVAVRAEAKWIVTFNLRDFPEEALAPFHIIALHPDEFICDLLTTRSEIAKSVIGEMLERHQKPPGSFQGLAETLEKLGLPRSGRAMSKWGRG